MIKLNFLSSFLLILSFFAFVQIGRCQDYIYILDGEQIKDSLEVISKSIDSNGTLFVKKTYYRSNPKQLASEMYYRNNKPNGTYRSYFPNGQLMEFSIYGNGIRHGEQTIYNEEGKIVIKGKFKNGLKHGYWSYLKDECFGRYKKGSKKGTWKCYENFVETKTKY